MKILTKADLLKEMRTAHRQLERYLFYFEKSPQGDFVAGRRAKFSEKEMLEPGVAGDWSLKGLLADLITWEGRFLIWQACWRDGESIPLDAPPKDAGETASEIEYISPELRKHTIGVMLEIFQDSFRKTLMAVESLSEEQLFTPSYFIWSGGQTLTEIIRAITSQRYDRVKGHIRRWIKRHPGKRLNKAEILRRIRTERHRLEKNLAQLSPEGLTRSGVIEAWSVKDILAHLVAWEQLFLGWFLAGLDGKVPETPAPGLTWGQLDILNNQIYEKHKDRPLVEIMAEFQSSYQQTLSTVESMTEEEIFQPGRYAWLGKGALAGYILANTANHYRWAKGHIRRWAQEIHFGDSS